MSVPSCPNWMLIVCWALSRKFAGQPQPEMNTFPKPLQLSDKRGFFVPPEWIRSFYPPLIQEKIRELSPPCARTGKREFLLFSGKSASSRRSSRKKRSFEDKVLQTLKKHQESFSAMASTHSGKVSSWSPLESTTGRSLCAFKRSRKESKSLPAWQKFS